MADVGSVLRLVRSAAQTAVLLVVAVGLGGAGTTRAPSPASPTTMVSGFHDALNNAAKSASGKSFAAREMAFAAVVRASYDTRFMARIAAGSYWDKLSPAERDALAAAFTDLTVASYASRFHAALPFTVMDQQPAAQDRVLVRARLQRKTGDVLKMSYLLEKSPSPRGWAIVDVWLNDTVSELALRRAEFAPVLRDKGAAALIADLRSKIDALPKLN